MNLRLRGILFSLSLLMVLLAGSPCLALGDKDPFVPIFVDDATEKVLGPFPYDRGQYAQALKILRQAGAKAVILKFFLDQVKPGTGDDALAAAIAGIPVVLQAKLDPKEPKPNPMPSSFDRSNSVEGDRTGLLGAESGWLPLEKFSRNCAGLGFANIVLNGDASGIQMVQRYQKALLPTIDLAAIEVALGQKATIRLGATLELAGHSIPLGPKGEVALELPAKDDLKALSFIDLINGKIDPKVLQGKVVILGFDAKETPSVPTSLGPLRIHRLFFYSIESLYRHLLAH